MSWFWTIVLAFVITNCIMAVVAVVGWKRGWFAVQEDHDDDTPH